MTIISASTPIPVEDESHDDDLDGAIRNYVRTYVLWHGRAKAAERFGVSRHTLWRSLERGSLGKARPRTVFTTVGDDPDAIAAATWAMTAVRQVRAPRRRQCHVPAGPWRIRCGSYGPRHY